MIAIVGAGAMGGMLAAKLFTSGKEVVLVDVSEQLVNEIRANGLTVDTKNGGTESHKIASTVRPDKIGECEAVFFFIKAQHTEAAARMAKSLVGPSTIVASLQNGWGNADVLAQIYDAHRIVVGVTYHSATVTGLGKVAHTGFGPTFIGPYEDQGSMKDAARVEQWMKDAGFEVEATPLVKTEIWKKLILNAVTLPTSALTGLCAGDQGQQGPLLDLLDELTAETVNVAHALGYKIELQERIERIHTVLQNAGKGKSSMLQDAQNRRKTEIEVINGAIVRAAEQTGVPAPLNRAMVALIGGLERSWQI